MSEYFGPPAGRKEWETQIATPVGQLCGYCEEAIEQGDAGVTMNYVTMVAGEPVGQRRPVHYECNMRQVIGSVAHIEGACSCSIPGSGEGDPEGATLREGALLALRAWRERQ